MQLMLFPKRNNCINVTGCISISIAIINRSVIIIVIIIIIILNLHNERNLNPIPVQAFTGNTVLYMLIPQLFN